MVTLALGSAESGQRVKPNSPSIGYLLGRRSFPQARRSTRQSSIPCEDDPSPSRPSCALTPQERNFRKRSSQRVMKEYLGDWEAFNEEKRAASALRRVQRTETANQIKGCW